MVGPSEADLCAIHDFNVHNSKFYARKDLLDIVEKSEVLGPLPRSGRVVPELGELDNRVIAVHTYRIVYETRGTDCHVLALLHKRRELQPESIER